MRHKTAGLVANDLESARITAVVIGTMSKPLEAVLRGLVTPFRNSPIGDTCVRNAARSVYSSIWPVPQVSLENCNAAGHERFSSTRRNQVKTVELSIDAIEPRDPDSDSLKRLNAMGQKGWNIACVREDLQLNRNLLFIIEREVENPDT